MLRVAYLVGLVALTVFYHFFFGAGPSPSEFVDDLEWWRPWGTFMHAPSLIGLAQMARAGGWQTAEVIVGAWLPLLAYATLGWNLFRRALPRAVIAFLTALAMLFVYYGLRAEDIWRFLDWRFVPVAAAVCGVVIAIAFSASLLDETLRRSRALALLFVLAAGLTILLLTTDVTGTNSQIALNVSPWPILTLVGFLLVGAVLAVLHAASGAALWLHARLSDGLRTPVALAAAAAVGGLGSAFVFEAPRARVGVALAALLVAWLRIALAGRAPDRESRAGAVRFATGAVLLLAILGSARVAADLQRRARDVNAVQVLDALEKFKKENATYPDSLEVLVPKYLAAVPRPGIGLLRDENDRFNYTNYGDSYALEFASVLWVQCQYSPPYEFSADSGEDAEEQDSPFETPPQGKKKPADVAAAPSEDDAEAKVTLAKHGLNGSWTCPKEPPKLW